MTPKEKATELYEKMRREEYSLAAKRCALIAVDEIVNCDRYFNTLADAKEFINYWYEVQQEIEKL